MVVASLISGNLHSPLWHSDAILGRGDHPINAHSEKLKHYILNTELYEKSRLDMSVYRNWVELAMSFD
ncbi:hypothetical protein BJP24_06810 [Aeromonas allosaccharophila]|nr:hypothetical protein BJP24_06810 [Aeromonas allosaccharophila]